VTALCSETLEAHDCDGRGASHLLSESPSRALACVAPVAVLVGVQPEPVRGREPHRTEAWSVFLGGEARLRDAYVNHNRRGQGPQDPDGSILQLDLLHADVHLGPRANMATTSFLPMGNSADSPAPFLRRSPATGHDVAILDVEDPYVRYDAETCLYHQPSRNRGPRV
jgi:hypothetical protein